MGARTHPVRYTFREYLAHEAASNTKHEYLDGQIYAMAGGTPEHSALIASVTTHLSNAVRGGRCRMHMSGLRIRVRETGLATYPWARALATPGATVAIAALGATLDATLDVSAVYDDAREPA